MVWDERLYRACRSSDEKQHMLTLFLPEGKKEEVSYWGRAGFNFDDTSLEIDLSHHHILLKGQNLSELVPDLEKCAVKSISVFRDDWYDPPSPGQPVVHDIVITPREWPLPRPYLT